MNEEPGAVWINRIAETYKQSIWLNPVDERHWDWTPSIGIVRNLVGGRMYPLTRDGLDAG